MTKKTIIYKIKEIISEWGSLNTSELEIDSPVHKFMNKDNYALIEAFNLDDVCATEYVHETVVGEQDIMYETLDVDTLSDILTALENYVVEMNKLTNEK